MQPCKMADRFSCCYRSAAHLLTLHSFLLSTTDFVCFTVMTCSTCCGVPCIQGSMLSAYRVACCLHGRAICPGTSACSTDAACQGVQVCYLQGVSQIRTGTTLQVCVCFALPDTDFSVVILVAYSRYTIATGLRVHYIRLPQVTTGNQAGIMLSICHRSTWVTFLQALTTQYRSVME